MSDIIVSLESLIKDLSQFRKAYAKLCYPYLAKYSLSPCEIDILIFLSNNPSIHTAKELVIYLGVAKSLIARSVDNLVKRELLTVEVDTQDRRLQLLSLTTSSNEIITLIKTKKDEFSELSTKNITPERLEQVRAVIAQMNQNIEGLLKGVSEE